MKKNIVIFGATSKIAEETARLWAIEGHRLILVGRSLERLEPMKQDLHSRGAEEVKTLELDFANHLSHESFVDDLYQENDSRIDIVMLCHGLLGSQMEDQSSIEKSLEVIDVNFLSYVSLLTPLANKLESAKKGSLIIVSSVAGDRGRQSNYIYGCAKGAISIFAEGLRNRLDRSGVNVITIKPGFVDTPMTKDIEKNKLFALPEDIAYGILKAEEKRKSVVYLPVFWLFIMTIIKLIPERVFRKLKL